MKRWTIIQVNLALAALLLFSSGCSAAESAGPAAEAGQVTTQAAADTAAPAVPPAAAATATPGSDPASASSAASAAPAQQPAGETPAPAQPKAPRATRAAQGGGKQGGGGGKQGGAGAAPTAQSANPDFIATEILGRPTDRSVTANVVPATTMEISYEYGTTPGAYTGQTAPQSAAAGTPIETLIDGLQPGTRYYYRLRYQGSSGESAGPERSFVTQRQPGSAFSFAIQGDSHPERYKNQFDPALYTRTLTSAAAAQPDFFLTIGDDFSVDTLKTVNPETVTALYVNQRQYLGLLGAPVFLVNGNHEQAALANLDGTPDNVAVWAQNARNAYYPQPAPDAFYSGDAEPVEHIGLLRDYYAWTWGDALFVVIDPYWHSPQAVDNTFGDRSQKKNRDLWNVTLGETQYQWLKQTLESSPAKYKFVFAHHVHGTGRGGVELAGQYEWGDAAGLAAYRPGWTQTIHQLMAENGVTIFFQGHDHLFARQELDGVIYQTLPEPANPNYTIENASSYLSGDILPNSGHLQVNVTPSGVSVTYVRSYLDQPDEAAFTYTIPAPR